ncbi:MAG: TonB-dependent receptor [Candidatus Eremiobacteraeota bacterium]|nr:TonB-dependent receptor [Candidatus Eremiobacteraeota bacterium]
MHMFIRRRIVIALVCVGFVGANVLPVIAGTTGAIQGYITTEAGQPLTAVAVTAASPSGHFTTISGAGGFYSFNGLPLDTYTLTFSKEGYQATSIPGVTTVQDQPNRVNTHLSSSVKSLGRVTVRGQTSLVQPTVTANTYVINQQRLSDLNGTPQDLNGFAAFNSLPGVTPDNAGFPTIRAGAQNDVGYQIDGVDNTEIGTAEYLNALTLNGARSVQISTGGYDVSNGNTNSGVINEVIKRGAYPGQGQATLRVDSLTFGHELSLDYGNATPNNRFSYYFSFGGSRLASTYGDRATLLPLEVGQSEFSSINDGIVNLFYHFGDQNKNEIQFLTNLSGQTLNFNYLAFPPVAPYASNNGNVQAGSDPFGFGSGTFIVPPGFGLPAMLQSNYITLIPGQAGYQQNTNVADTQTFNSIIDKLNFKRQLSASSFAEVRLTKTYLNWVDWYPWDLGSFSDVFFNENATALGEAFDYTNQLTSKNELSFGGDGTFYKTEYWNSFPSFEPFDQPLSDLGCPQVFASTGRTNLGGGCYIAPYNAALNAANAANGGTLLTAPLPTDPAHAPLNSYVDNASYANDPVHRWDLWFKDRWQPNERLTVTLGLRWDKESIAIPSNAAQLNTTYFFDASGNVVTVPGNPIGTDVTQPQQISPRIAASYEVSPRDTVRFSFGRNIEFAPLGALENAYRVPTSLQSCNIASGCFIPLPGFGTTNNITNLYQQMVLDLTTNNFAQYTPLVPQTAVNVDFSYEHDFGRGLELRLTPYYRKGKNYFVSNQPLLFTLPPPSNKQIFGPIKQQNAGINENTGIEFALQRNAPYGLSGLLDATYDNTLANYDGDFFPGGGTGLNAAALAANHFYHVTYVAPLSGTFNLVYNTHTGFHAATTVNYFSGFRYGVGTKTFIFGANGQPEQVLNTDLAATSSRAYYTTDPTNPGTPEHPNITGSRGTNEGDDPGSLFGPPIAVVNVTLSQDLGRGARNAQAGIRVENLLGNYSPTTIPSNIYYVAQGIGSYGPGSGVNPNQCAPGVTFACEPFSYNQSVHPYEVERTGPPRLFTFFVSVKY